MQGELHRPGFVGAFVETDQLLPLDQCPLHRANHVEVPAVIGELEIEHLRELLRLPENRL